MLSLLIRGSVQFVVLILVLFGSIQSCVKFSTIHHWAIFKLGSVWTRFWVCLVYL